MKKFLVKTTYTATEKNNNFAGEVQVWFTGKGEKHFKETDEELFKIYITDKYGYNRKCDVKRSPALKSESSEFWNVCSEIVEFEV